MPTVSTNKKGVFCWWVALMGSDGAESLSKQSMICLQWVIMASVMASNVPDGLLKWLIKLETI